MNLKKAIKNLIYYLYSLSVLSLAITALMIFVNGFAYGFENFDLTRLIIIIVLPIIFFLVIHFVKKKIDKNNPDSQS